MKHRHPRPLACRICGDLARGVNFSVVTCMSCKMFFRRHAQSQSLRQRECQFDGNCNLTRNTRKYCSPCRLKQCFEAGMDPKLIRRSFQHNKRIKLPKITSLNLLDKDRSMLTLDEWNLLSNIINTYNEQNLFMQAKDFLRNHISLPPKIRSKDSNTLNHIGSLFSTINTFIERCPLYNSLSPNIRKALIKRNLNTVGSFNGFYMAKEMNISENEIYSDMLDNIYGYGQSNSVIQATKRLEQNGTLIKIMLMILAFSSNTAVLGIDHFDDIQIIVDPKILIYIEHIFVTMFSKYLIYQYGFNGAILKFSSLVQSILDLMQKVSKGSNIPKHWNMVENIVQQITYSLNLEDYTCERMSRYGDSNHYFNQKNDWIA